MKMLSLLVFLVVVVCFLFVCSCVSFLLLKLSFLKGMDRILINECFVFI